MAELPWVLKRLHVASAPTRRHTREVSREAVDVVRRSVEAFSRRDVEGVLADTRHDHEWVISPQSPEARTLHGHAEIADYLSDWWCALDELRYDIDELIDAGDAVVCVGTLTGRPKGADAEVTVPFATVTDFREGIPIRTREFLTKDSALTAVGLAEERR